MRRLMDASHSRATPPSPPSPPLPPPSSPSPPLHTTSPPASASFVQLDPLAASVPITDRLRSRIAVWRTVASDPFVLSVIERGVLLPLQSRRTLERWRSRLTGTESARAFSGTPAQMLDLRRQIADWQAQRVIEPARHSGNGSRNVCALPALASLLFPVPKRDSHEFRWCHDSRATNDALRPRRCKVEGLATVRTMLRRGDWLCSIDLKSAYNHLTIHPSHRSLLEFHALGRRFRFVGMPFGVSCAPYVFTRVMRAVMRYLRQRAFRVSIYLDDLIIAASSRELCARHAALTAGLLETLGFVLNYPKCELTPQTTLRHLGVWIDTRQWRLTLPRDKIVAIAKDARRALRDSDDGALSVRRLAGLAGKLAAALPAMPAARFRIHSLQRCVAFGLRRHRSWDGTVALSASARRDVSWAASLPALRRSNGAPIRAPPSQATITTDASASGWGATLHLRSSTMPIVIAQRWPTTMSASLTSSNWRETTAISLAIAHFGRLLNRCRSLTIRSDNTSAVAALRRWGARSPALGRAIEPALRWLLRRRIALTALHIPGVENTTADSLSRWFDPSTPAATAASLPASATPATSAPATSATSRSTSRWLVDRNEWTLSPSCFRAICRTFGTPTVDLFASPVNHLCRQFCSIRRPLPHQGQPLALDAFATDWSRFRLALIVPPVNLIPRALAKAMDEQTNSIIVVPNWPTRPWFGTLLSIATGPPLLLPYRDSSSEPLFKRREGRSERSANRVSGGGAWGPACWPSRELMAFHIRP